MVQGYLSKCTTDKKKKSFCFVCRRGRWGYDPLGTPTKNKQKNMVPKKKKC